MYLESEENDILWVRNNHKFTIGPTKYENTWKRITITQRGRNEADLQCKSIYRRRHESQIMSQISLRPIYGKGRILEYLKGFPVDCAAAMSLCDEVTGKTLGAGVCGYEDKNGGWYWDDRMIYHFEKYNMKLSEEFINYVLTFFNSL